MSVPETGYQLNKTGAQTDDILARAAAGGEIDMALAAKAPLNSPAFTGTPTAPTPSASDISTKVATTALVHAVVGNKTPVRVVDYDLATSALWNVWVAYINGGFSLILRVATPDENSYYHYYSLVNYAHYSENGASVYEMIFERVDGNVIDQRTLKRTVNGGISTFEWTQTTTNIQDIADAIYKAFATDNASGSIASFPDGADDIPVKSLVAQITPLQSGTGDPAPDNIRPISGWTGAKITRCGKNLLPSDLTWVNNKYIKEDGTVATLNGFHYSSMFEIKPNTQYAVQYYVAAATSGSFLVNLYDGSMNVLGWAVPIAASPSAAGTYSGEFTSPATAAYARISTNNQYTNLQFELGSTATTYEAYNGNTINVDWTDEAGTVYGGTLTYIGGGKYSLQATKTKINADTLSWVYNGTDYPYGYFTATASPAKAANMNFICSIYANLGNGRNQMGDADKQIGVYNKNSSGYTRFVIRDDAYTSDASFATYLQSLTTAGTPADIVYDLATLPDPIILDAEDVKTLLGDNNIFCDTGDVDVTYRADTALYIDKKLAEA